eukprot:TRINITY_DN10724_c0_g1_i1.p1 TRINITY_DN10724_c0_g1~~TRINITY_DN10724_c0_g1_i1.p1  ORF type:complete len:664 (+),score=225.72 TRINITY_DN10724_c0_g1_i1:84-1994(+)
MAVELGNAPGEWPGPFPEGPTAAVPAQATDKEGKPKLRLTIGGTVLDEVCPLGGSAESHKLVSRSSGRFYVCKKRIRPEQCRNERNANFIYAHCGGHAPRTWIHKEQGSCFVVQEWIEGQLLQEIEKGGGKAAYESARKATQSVAALDMLFTNYDVIGGRGGDNIIIDGSGLAFRIDNAGVFGIRAQGGPKDGWRTGKNGLGEDGKELVNEHRHFREGGMNPQCVQVFHDLTDDDLMAQLDRLSAAASWVMAPLTAHDREILEQRMVSLRRQLRGAEDLLKELAEETGCPQEQVQSVLREAKGSLPHARAILCPLPTYLAWSCKTDDGWRPFPEPDARMLEYHYQKRSGEVLTNVTCTFSSSHKYRFDLSGSRFLQVNEGTGAERALRREDGTHYDPHGDDEDGGEEEEEEEEVGDDDDAGGGDEDEAEDEEEEGDGDAVWSCETDGGRRDYGPPDCQLLERAYRSGATLSNVQLSFSAKHRYNFDFARMVQCNVATGVERQLHRRVQPVGAAGAAPSGGAVHELAGIPGLCGDVLLAADALRRAKGSVPHACALLAPPSVLGGVTWEFHASSGWHAMGADDAKLLEAHRRFRSAKPLTGVALSRGSHTYDFDLSSTPMTQTNCSTGNVREIRRRA